MYYTNDQFKGNVLKYEVSFYTEKKTFSQNRELLTALLTQLQLNYVDTWHEKTQPPPKKK